MKRPLNNRTWVFGATVSALALTWSSASFAQDTVVVNQPAPAPAAEGSTAGYSGPNRALIGSGLVTFGLSYIPAVIVAGESGQSTDHHLYVPVIGPWLDLGDRPGCGAGSIGCDSESTNKVLLAVDGVFQGLGVLTTVAGFLTPESHVVTTRTAEADKPTLHLSPAHLGAAGYGLAAFGSF